MLQYRRRMPQYSRLLLHIFQKRMHGLEVSADLLALITFEASLIVLLCTQTTRLWGNGWLLQSSRCYRGICSSVPTGSSDR